MARPPFWYLERLDLFERVPRPELAALRDGALVREFPRRARVTLDDPGESVYLIAEGAAKLCHTGFLGRRIIEAILQPGDVFGRITLEGRAQSPCILETIDETRVLFVPRSTFTALMRSCPEFSYEVVQRLEERERRLERRVESLVFKDVRTRVIETILYLARNHGDRCVHGWAVDVRVTQQDIADLVGASRQIVSRVLRELELKFYVRRKGRVICILSMKRLARLAGEEL
jgi:CRP-like cAMP-binding protein